LAEKQGHFRQNIILEVKK